AVSHHRQHLAGDPVQPGDPLLRAAEHPGGPVRGRSVGRGERRAEVLEHHDAVAAPGLSDHAAARTDLHPEGGGCHLGDDHRWSRRHLHHPGDLVLPRSLRDRAAGVLPGCGGGEPADRHRAGVRLPAPAAAASAGGVMIGRRSLSRTWWKTCLGVLFTAIMLFPAYWMLNASLTRTSDLRADPPHWFPWDPTFEGYQAVLDQQL